jgi:hypothetical protein
LNALATATDELGAVRDALIAAGFTDVEMRDGKDVLAKRAVTARS